MIGKDVLLIGTLTAGLLCGSDIPVGTWITSASPNCSRDAVAAWPNGGIVGCTGTVTCYRVSIGAWLSIIRTTAVYRISALASGTACRRGVTAFHAETNSYSFSALMSEKASMIQAYDGDSANLFVQHRTRPCFGAPVQVSNIPFALWRCL